MADLKIVFFGTPEFVIPVLESLSDTFNIVGVVTTPDRPFGRDQVITQTPIKKYALEDKLKVLTPEVLDEKFTEELKSLDADLYALASYGKIIPQEVLDLPRFGMINIHPSLLPKYRGASPIPAAILNGDKITGITIMKVDSQMDHGEIIYQEQVEILPNETTEKLLKRAFERSAHFLPKVIEDYTSGKIIPTSQDDSQATYTWKTSQTKQKAYFDIEKPPTSEELDRMVRAFYPSPDVWTNWKGKIVKFYPDKIIQIEGKKPILFEEFLKGYPDFPLKEI